VITDLLIALVDRLSKWLKSDEDRPPIRYIDIDFPDEPDEETGKRRLFRLRFQKDAGGNFSDKKTRQSTRQFLGGSARALPANHGREPLVVAAPPPRALSVLLAAGSRAAVITKHFC